MACYIVTYDLNKETKRPNILKDIKGLGGWAKLSESSYAVSTSKTPSEVFNHLKKHIDGNDNLYIISLSRPFFGQGPTDVNEWLERNLPW
ncbi:hypothetical protein T8A63_07370 [Sulfitobacter sp. OXR-159]|uniref:hypothetical protein n=1 Tax=Sulfitobacter sp. OXR-159 TaxID=3100174 RepID=UPI002AC8ECCA|nr:hypothetical protein [Sulfitobacter sp. OXR-159]WPZ30775.1 hypothetical protein T8A63_06860 [Sulfitobacter sp. OXR-159]WPZ30876.1 hypothetical protein T8A63_07370 [Sulfitobacter sp. OXR-159]